MRLGTSAVRDWFRQRGAAHSASQLADFNDDEGHVIGEGAVPKGPVMDMFWAGRCGTVVDPEGYTWMVASHIAQPTPEEMQQKMKEQWSANRQPALRVAPE